jgi:hypothetical protein
MGARGDKRTALTAHATHSPTSRPVILHRKQLKASATVDVRGCGGWQVLKQVVYTLLEVLAAWRLVEARTHADHPLLS